MAAGGWCLPFLGAQPRSPPAHIASPGVGGQGRRGWGFPRERRSPQAQRPLEARRQFACSSSAGFGHMSLPLCGPRIPLLLTHGPAEPGSFPLKPWKPKGSGSISFPRSWAICPAPHLFLEGLPFMILAIVPCLDLAL